MRRKLVSIVGILGIWSAASGCSMYMAVSGPGPIDRSVLKEGTHRTEVIRAFGAPASSRESPGGITSDVYRAKDGWPLWFNISRALAHGAGDFFTLFLWEVAAIPLEAAAFSASDVVIEVDYDAEDLLARGLLRDSRGRTRLEIGGPSKSATAPGVLAEARGARRR